MITVKNLIMGINSYFIAAEYAESGIRRKRSLSSVLPGHRKCRKKLNHSSFTFTVYNVLGRKNPYLIFFRTEEGEIKGYQMTIFSQPIIMASYSFRIRGNATGDF